VWLAIAAAMAGKHQMAHTLFTMLNPIHITSKRKDALRYEKEPYVVIGDISSCAPCTGRGGWSWYTGSAGWMYQGLVKYFLGIRKEGGHLVIDPASPASFGDYTVYYRYGTSEYQIKVERLPEGMLSQPEITVDGVRQKGCRVGLWDDDRVHQVKVML